MDREKERVGVCLPVKLHSGTVTTDDGRTICTDKLVSSTYSKVLLRMRRGREMCVLLGGGGGEREKDEPMKMQSGSVVTDDGRTIDIDKLFSSTYSRILSR